MAAIGDQSTSELRANLLARRGWARTVTGWRRQDALRDIREIEDELEARGETLEEPNLKPKPKRPEPSRHGTLTRWYAVGFHDQPGWPVPKHNKRHIDRRCGYLADKPDEDIRELSEQEITEHAPCRGAAG
jgi:hypothetical protein